ncbi:MAG TPA: cupredoxin family copper-binding protein [Rhodopseudomonas sp.]|uniref:cupredoxin domain-containing protein n=1 Tax=Rhodopseudomonas sp. TaxID=1078 RepID=UPI002ED89A3E
MTMFSFRHLGVRLGVAAIMATQISVARCEDAAVMIDNFTFEPAQLTIKAGSTVTWKNRDDIPHALVSVGHFKSKVLDTDDSYAFSFTQAGSYSYFCSLHPHMTGTIKVE